MDTMLRVVITEASFGEKFNTEVDQPGLNIVSSVQPFMLTEAQRQGRRTATTAELLEDDEPAVSPELAAALASADIVVGQDFPLRLDELSPNLQLMQVLSSGVDHLKHCHLPATAQVANAAGISAESVAEWVLTQILIYLKRSRQVWQQQTQQVWVPQHGGRLRDKRVVIAGYGAIGSAVARMLAFHGAQVTAVRRTPGQPDTAGVCVVGVQQLPDVVETADIIVSALPAGPSATHTFDSALFGAMKKQPLFINVGRGQSVDESALVDAVTSGQLAEASLDVMTQEPLPADHFLWSVPGIHISPHSAVSFEGYAQDAITLVVDNITRLKQGKELRNPVALS